MKSNLNGWESYIGGEFTKEYFTKLERMMESEYEQYTVYPKRDQIFSALTYTAYEKVKVVILGQDPYHGPEQAHGLSFSVLPGVPMPPSLKNIFKELQNDLGIPIPNHGYLKKWAKEGVLLLNTVLTVRAGEAHSHKKMGWEKFTDAVITKLSNREEPMVFVLWGKPAQEKKKLISGHHYIIEAPHPSPLSAYRGFFGSEPFSKTNKWLKENGYSEIDWTIE
ncbi:uracil-DNA glycosylase [Robertmurraya korlensis]|uniref:uracil-DNA glycosylase n=1 Tax=Robertmurraya korlensis TaxID=519977 RepID=UPI000826D50B|nr:uracil-DNA glycosylase [Robertmurraya korlensis]